MNKFILKNKKILVTGGVVLILFGAGYSVMSYRNFNKNSIKDSDRLQEQKKESEVQDNNKRTDDEETEGPPVENTKKNYEITKLNKKDGDVFSVPDDVFFTITPAVDKSKITLTSAEGAVLYTQEIAGSDAKFTVYPEKKVAEGTQGELLVEGYVGSNVVVYQKIKVVF